MTLSRQPRCSGYLAEMRIALIARTLALQALLLAVPAQAQSPRERPPAKYPNFMGSPILTLPKEALGPGPTEPPAAQAVEGVFPVIAVEAECHRAYGKTGNATIAQCIRREQPSYDFAKFAWERVSDESRRKCVQSANDASSPRAMGRHVFYSVLSECLSGALIVEGQRRDAVQPPRFRY